MKAPTADKDASFIETPNGIFTAAGSWFHTTVEALKAYAGPVLTHKSIAQLLHFAELWLRSPKTLVLWMTPFLLWTLGIAPTLLCCVLVYFIFSIWGPAMITQTLTPVLNVLDNVLIQAVLYISGMSWFAMNGYFTLMIAGLVIFILMRWGLIAKVLNPWIMKIRQRLYKVPYEDQILKAVIVHAAMKHRVALPELDQMEMFILNRINKK
ncbi:MAG: hypothetical protein AB8G77_05675 [Rhodothermales bacterium]